MLTRLWSSRQRERGFISARYRRPDDSPDAMWSELNMEITGTLLCVRTAKELSKFHTFWKIQKQAFCPDILLPGAGDEHREPCRR